MEAATVPPPPEQPPPPPTPQEEAALAALTVILLSGMAAAAATAQATAVLALLRIPEGAARTAVSLVVESPIAYSGAGHASRQIRRTSSPRRAMHVLNAAKRLAAGGTIAAERRYLGQHLQAERGRVQAAKSVDRVAARYGPVVGWHAKQPFDEVSSPGCRSRHRSNFDVRRPPLVEGRPAFPGAVHPACRCTAGKPWPGARTIS